jgi:hypothetical protein
MKLPPLHGNIITESTIVFTSADENYFNFYAKALINSIKRHTNLAVHIHLYNPSNDTKLWCRENSVTYSFEIINPVILKPTFDRWVGEQVDPESRRKKMGMVKDPNDHSRLEQEILRTYYACTRFVRLAELLIKPTYVLMLDIDSIVRKEFILPGQEADIHIFEKRHKKHVPYTQHLASTIFYTGTSTSLQLIKNHADLILQEYCKDELYWFLDQDTLDIAIQACQKKALDSALVDFDMKDASPIWCAKGPRKFKDRYLNEIKNYI